MTSSLHALLRNSGGRLFALRSAALWHAQPSRVQQFARSRQVEQLLRVNRMSSMSSDDIKILKVENKDRERILEFLRKHYYAEEPLTIGTEPKQQDPADEEFHMSNIPHGLSLMAVQSSAAAKEVVVGTVIAGPKKCDEADQLAAEAERLGPTKWGKVLKLLACIERDANVCERYGVERVLHAHMLAVDASVRGRALGARLMKAVMALGRQLGYPLITVDCSSLYSARLCERLQMECINSVTYASYLDEKGEPVFKPPPPHEAVLTYAKRL